MKQGVSGGYDFIKRDETKARTVDTNAMNDLPLRCQNNLQIISNKTLDGIMTRNLFILTAILLYAAVSVSEASVVTTTQRPAIKNRASSLNEAVERAPDGSARRGVLRTSVKTKPMKAPDRITAGGSAIYGYSIFSMGDDYMGMYDIGATGITPLWPDSFYSDEGVYLANGVLIDGRLYGNTLPSFFATETTEHWIVYDFADGEVISSSELDFENDAPYITRMSFNTQDGCLYYEGIHPGYEGGRVMVTMKSPLDDIRNVTFLAPVSNDMILRGMCYVAPENCFYGITSGSDLIRIDTDGTRTAVGLLDLSEIGFSPDYDLGMVYSPVEDVIYLTPSSDSASYLVTVSLDGNDIDIIYPFENSNQIVFLTTSDQYVYDPLKPEAPAFVSCDFPNGSTTGHCILKMPSATADGSVITGGIEALISLDGFLYGEFPARGGEELRVDFSDISPDMHSFGCSVDYNGHVGRAVIHRTYIGNDTPCAPGNVVLSEGIVSWDAVTEGVNGGYVDLDAMAYSVEINGIPYGTTSDLHLDISLPGDDELQLYKAEVYASCNGMVSSPGCSNSIAVGRPLALPVNIVPTSDQVELCSVIDANDDGKTWKYNQTVDAFDISYTTSGEPHDDWLFMPPVSVGQTSGYLSMSFDTALRNSDYSNEYLEVWIGPKPAPGDMTCCLMERFTPDADIADKFATVETLFKNEGADILYVGFHCVSDADQMGLFVRNIKLDNSSISDDSPAPPRNMTVSPGDCGALSATVSFEMPLKTLGGADFGPDTRITAAIASDAEMKTLAGVPGEAMSAELATLQGDNTISVTLSIDGLNGVTQYVSVYTGVYPPAVPEITRIDLNPDMSGLTMSWNPVTASAEKDGYIDPATVTYSIYRLVQSPYGNYWEPVAENLTECHYTYSICEGEAMAVTGIGVASANEAGNCGQLNYTMAYLGTPYTLPVEEAFADNRLSINPWVVYTPDSDYTGTWGANMLQYLVDIPDADPETLCFAAIGTEGAKARMGIPRFSTRNVDEAYLVFDTYTGEYAADLTVLAICHEISEPVVIGEIIHGGMEEIASTTFSIPSELLDKDWIEIYLDAYFHSPESVGIMTYFAASAGNGIIPSLDATSKCSVRGSLGRIVFEGHAGDEMSVATIDGIIVESGIIPDNECAVAAAPGIYMVRIGNTAVKVVVR